MAAALTGSTQEWLDKAQSLAGVIEAHRDESEQGRRMARPIFEAAKASGLFEMMVPRRLGGPQADFASHVRMIEELARHDGAAAWNVMIWSDQGMFADYMTEETAAQILSAGSGNLIAGALNPTGRGVTVEGGYRLTGRWSFASGCEYATWLLAGFVVMDGEAPHFVAEDMPELRLALVPAADCSVVDTWHAAGLRGTGSHDFEVTDVFVPEARTLVLPQLFLGPAPRDGTAYRTPFADLAVMTLTAVALGIARDAIESFKDVAGRVPTIGRASLSDWHTVQEKVGWAEALLRSARAYVYETVAEVTSAHQAGAAVSDADSAAMRLAGTFATQNAVQAVDLMFEAAGGSSVYASSRLERCFRDVHVITHHMLVSPANIEMAGQFFLGGPLQVRR
jgi:alkylation response protein AidB-like acyl-CoA dehydrogenase